MAKYGVSTGGRCTRYRKGSAFACADNISQPDVFRIVRQTNAAAFATHRLDHPGHGHRAPLAHVQGAGPPLALDGLLGHGGIVVFDDTVDMARQARFAMEFCAIESCGKCTPCRIGSTRGVEVIDRLVNGENKLEQQALLTDLCDTMVAGSLCAMGGMTPYPVLSALNHYPADFGIDASAADPA